MVTKTLTLMIQTPEELCASMAVIRTPVVKIGSVFFSLIDESQALAGDEGDLY